MRVVLDLETCSTADLRRTGAQLYAEHPDTQVTVACFAIDSDPVETWVAGQPPPPRFVRAVTAGATVVAHNYLFEFNVYHRKLVPLGWPPIPVAQWSCTLARAYVAGLPGALETLSKALKLSIPKDASARGLMLRMARPRSVDPATGTIEWWHRTSPDHFNRLQGYCGTDVEAERLADRALPELSSRERRIFEVDHGINQRGLKIDEPLVVALRNVAAKNREDMTAELSKLSGGMVGSVNQVAKLRNWMAVWGSTLPDLRRATVAKALRDGGLHPNVQRALEIRRDISRSSVSKLDAIRDAHSSQDNRVRGCFQYYGASRTGRWAGRRLQPQNLFRGTINHNFVPQVIGAVMHGAEPDDLDLFGESPMSVIASCLRSCIMAAPGRKLVIVDYAQIEARVLAWLAGQWRALETFRKGEDIYTRTAADIGSTSRLLGKVLVLACGFGMGPDRFQETARSYGLELDVVQCMQLVQAWREANREIVRYWYNCYNALLRVARRHRLVDTVGHVAFLRRGKSILIRLPSGRHLVYRHPEIDADGQFTYMGNLGGGWMRLRSWPGKIVENITQAVARDVLADALVVLGTKVPLVGQVHDELIAEPIENNAVAALDLMTKTMKAPLAWAPGLPLDAKGLISDRYVKG